MEGNQKKFILGICAMDTKARSKPMRNILDRILSKGDMEAIIFGDKVILDEDISQWPNCDFLISFFSTGFPLEKAIDYVKLRKPICLNDVPMQLLLWDRRLVLALLDAIGVPTPKRLTTWHKDPPTLPKSVLNKAAKLGLNIEKYRKQIITASLIDSETIEVNGEQLKKPFVEKPVSGEDHNIFIYYSKENGGGVRKLFRKKGNKSSEYFPECDGIRCDGVSSFIYEEFMEVDNAEDVKVYTIGQEYAHAETRKSPVVDGVVKRNADGKEIRYITELSIQEQTIARRVCQTFGQTVCGFDLLRANGRSYVIDVNGWSFVKGNTNYYDNCATIIHETFIRELKKRGPSLIKQPTVSESQWKLKAFMSVMRHADRTPKQKVKYTFESETFLNLVRHCEDEIVYKNEKHFKIVMKAIEVAIEKKEQGQDYLQRIQNILLAKGKLAGTKVQLRPIFSKETRILEKMQLIIKWGGLFTHGGFAHSKDLGENLRTDLNIINKQLLQDIQVLSSSEKRVVDTAETFCKALLDVETLEPNFILVTKEMLDDSNAAKEQTDFVKSKLQVILNPEYHVKPPAEFIMPMGWIDFSKPIQELIDLLKRLRDIMNENLKIPKIDMLWCCFETPYLFRERWEKLFRDFCDVERMKFEPSKISELYDALKFDLIHNREYLYYSFYHPTENLTALLCQKSKDLFDIIGPHEYGIEDDEKLEIGLKNSQHLLRHIIDQLCAAQESPRPLTRLYFTKESKVYSLLNVCLLCGLKTKVRPTDIAELDYLTQITFELYERASGPNDLERSEPEYSVRIGFSPGAHDPNLIELQLDSKHSLSVTPRKWLTDHIPLEEALKCFQQYDILNASN